MPVKCPPPSWVSAPVSALSPGPHSGESPGSETGPRAGVRGTDISPKRSVFKEAPVMPFALEPCPGDGHLGGSRTRARSAPWCPRLVVFLHL